MPQEALVYNAPLVPHIPTSSLEPNIARVNGAHLDFGCDLRLAFIPPAVDFVDDKPHVVDVGADVWHACEGHRAAGTVIQGHGN